MDSSTALEKRGPTSVVAPQTFTEMLAFAERIADTDFVPKDMRSKPGAVLAAVQFGAELGLGPMQSLRNLHVIHGKVGMSGDLMLGLARGTKDLVTYEEHFVDGADVEGACPYCGEAYATHKRVRGAERHAYVVIERRNRPKTISSFSLSDAKRVNVKEDSRAITLDQKAMYQQWPQRMYVMRAREFGLRTEFADLFAGVYSPEELRETIDGEVVTAAPAPAAESPWAWVPDDKQPALLDAFTKCKLSAAAQRVKLLEFKGRYDDLMDALKTEFANRNSPKGRSKKGAAPPAETPVPPPADTDTAARENAAIDAEIVAKEGAAK